MAAFQRGPKTAGSTHRLPQGSGRNAWPGRCRARLGLHDTSSELLHQPGGGSPSCAGQGWLPPSLDIPKRERQTCSISRLAASSGSLHVGRFIALSALTPPQTTLSAAATRCCAGALDRQRPPAGPSRSPGQLAPTVSASSPPSPMYTPAMTPARSSGGILRFSRSPPALRCSRRVFWDPTLHLAALVYCSAAAVQNAAAARTCMPHHSTGPTQCCAPMKRTFRGAITALAAPSATMIS
jgi:hypothetical protein